jgi:hypothetical protein
MKEKDLILRRKTLLKKLVKADTWIMGSVIETTRIQSGNEKPFYYLSRSVNGKTKTTYISKKHLNEFKEARDKGKDIQVIMDKIIEINIEILKLRKG